MNHLILLVVCLLSVEIFIRFNYIALINSTIKTIKKATYIILNKNISDHWKENVIPAYSLQMMKSSMQMLLVFLLIICIFLIVNNFFSGFLGFTFSLNGIIESILFAFSYAYIRKLIAKWIIIIVGWSKSCINLHFHRNLCVKSLLISNVQIFFLQVQLKIISLFQDWHVQEQLYY